MLSATLRNATTAACMHDHEVKMESERKRRLIKVRVQERMITGGRKDERLIDVATTSFVPTSVSLSLLPPTVSLHLYHG